MIIKLERQEIERLVRTGGRELSQDALNEMAIPSYMHRNPLIQWLLWKRLAITVRLAGLTGSERVLDFGCGFGVLLPTLCSCAAEVHATDLFPSIAAELVRQKKLKVTFHPAHQLDASLPDNTFDLVIAVESLEHVDTPRNFVMLFHKKLKSNGHMIVSGPAENLAYKIGRHLAGFSGRRGYHHSDINKLNNLIMQCGFNVRESAALPFNFPPYLFKILKYRKSTPTHNLGKE